MRVYLKAGAAPLATMAPRDEPVRTNGNGGSHGPNGEASAFRELLTEFRNLTERYGQALLALGEARGEVAGLRSRVELLEARLDLRLPAGPGAAPFSWDASADTLPAPGPPVPDPGSVEVETAAPRPVRPAGRSPRPRKARSTRAAVAGFKQALERAQDPTVSDLADVSPPAPDLESSAAPTAPPAAAAGDSFVASVPEPFELPDTPFEPRLTAEGGPQPATDAMTEPEPVAAADVVSADTPVQQDEPQPVYSATVVEPDWFADGDFAWLDAADVEARTTPAVETASGPEPDALAVPEVRQSGEAAAEPELMVQPEPERSAEAPAEPAPGPTEDSFSVSESYPEADWRGPSPGEPQAAIEQAPTTQPEPVRDQDPDHQRPEAVQSVEPVQAGGSVAVAVEEEVMWIGAEPTAETEFASAGRLDEPDSAPLEVAPLEVAPLDTIVWPTTDPVLPVAPPEPKLLSMTEEELARLAHDEGWDEAEVAAIRAMIAPPAPRSGPLPGSAELGDAMAALRAVPVQADEPSAPVRQWAKPPIGAGAPPRYDDWAFEVESRPQLPQPQAPQRQEPFQAPFAAPRRPVEDPNWLRRREGPAASAYRRLRRLFPG